MDNMMDGSECEYEMKSKADHIEAAKLWHYLIRS